MNERRKTPRLKKAEAISGVPNETVQLPLTANPI
jgi:hypothetical protein